MQQSFIFLLFCTLHGQPWKKGKKVRQDPSRTLSHNKKKFTN